MVESWSHGEQSTAFLGHVRMSASYALTWELYPRVLLIMQRMWRSNS